MFMNHDILPELSVPYFVFWFFFSTIRIAYVNHIKKQDDRILMILNVYSFVFVMFFVFFLFLLLKYCYALMS